MKVEFPREEVPEAFIMPHYKTLMDVHMHYSKMQTKQDFTYIKYGGIFFLSLAGFMVMEGKGLISNYLIAVLFSGIGILLASLISILFISPEIDFNCAVNEEEGKRLEERYPSIVNFTYFKTISKTKNHRQYGMLINRLAPFLFVGGFTIWSGVMLALKTSFLLALIVGLSFSVALMASIFFLGRRIKSGLKVKQPI